MKKVQAVAKYLEMAVKYAGILIIIGETIEYGYKRFAEKYGVQTEQKEAV